MTQLTSLDLAGALHPSAGLEQWSMRGAAGRARMLLRGAAVRGAEAMQRVWTRRADRGLCVQEMTSEQTALHPWHRF